MNLIDHSVAEVETKSTDSIYRLIIVAGLRSKQLLRGSKPRIDANPLRRKPTSIALEEVRLGLVNYSARGGPDKLPMSNHTEFSMGPLVGKATSG